MTPKNGYRFSEKIMLEYRGWDFPVSVRATSAFRDSHRRAALAEQADDLPHDRHVAVGPARPIFDAYLLDLAHGHVHERIEPDHLPGQPVLQRVLFRHEALEVRRSGPVARRPLPHRLHLPVNEIEADVDRVDV